MKQIIYPVAVFCAILIFLTSCGTASDNGPLAIDEDVDVCNACSMMVQDNQYSSQIVTSSGEAYKFDDVGCMAMYINDNQPDGQSYVRDFYTKEWVDIENALFITTKDVETPMNYGFISFASSANLEKFLSESSGTEVTWDDVLETMKDRMSDDENQHSHN